MDGLDLKLKILKCGLRIWDVSNSTSIHYSRLSMILNNRAEPTLEEIDKINKILKREENRRITTP